MKKMVTVRDLIAFLSQLPADMELIETRCSDYAPMDLDDWEIVKAVNMEPNMEYLQRFHPTMAASLQDRTKEYLHFRGN